MAMHLLLFEVTPGQDRMNEYLAIASRLKIELESAGGCQFLERFQRLDDPDKLLSFQLWDSEEAISAWRNNRSHREVQIYGRNGMFDDYRLRVARLLGEEEHLAHDLGRTVAVFQSSSPYLRAQLPEGARAQAFASLYRQGRYAHVIEPGHARLEELAPFCSAQQCDGCHVGLVTRDYGMFERSEAPPPLVL